MHPLLLALALLSAGCVIAWLVSLATHDVSFVDSLWPLFFLLAAVVYVSSIGTIDGWSIAVMALVASWSLRLSLHITWRNRGQPEDRRYRQIRANNQPHFRFKSLYIVFLLQGALAWAISFPLYYALRPTAEPGLLHLSGVVLWFIGFAFEAGGDWQLARFRARRDSGVEVLDSGLWRYTRHPNYFGEACIWWSFWLIAAASGGAWTVFSPLLMTLLLLRVSGVSLLERDIGSRRPGYRDYARRTSAFLPMPPKPAHDDAGDTA